MLEGLRAVQNTWIGKAMMIVIMGFIVVAFAIFGIGNTFKGFSSDEVARVGSIGITTAAFRQAYVTALQNLQQSQRRVITNQEAHIIGIDAQVLSRMVSDAVLDDRAAALGLAIPDAQLKKVILADKAFAGKSGAFDRSRYEAVLSENGYSVQSYEREERQDYMRQELIQAIIGGMEPPEAAIEAMHRYQDEVRSLDYVILPASVLGDIPLPDDAALQSFFDGRAESFSAPQYRKLVTLTLRPADLAKPESVSDDDARKLYEAEKDKRFFVPERRHLQQILFQVEADAAAAAARIKAGTPFASIVAERKLDDKDVDLGTIAKSAIFDKPVADAAFALPADGVSDPIKGTFGWVLIHVAAIEPESLKPFEAVAEDLKREIALQRSGKPFDDLRGKIEDARSAGKTLTEAAHAAGLEPKVIDAVDAAGKDASGQPITGVPDLPALVKAAFASDVGVDNDTIKLADGGLIWFEVAAINPAHKRSLAEVRPAVEAAWRADETTKRLAAKADDFVKALDGGQTLEQVAAAAGNLQVLHIGDAKRFGAKGLNNEAVAKVFDVPVGSAGSAAEGDDARILFKVLDSLVPPLDPDAPQSKRMHEVYRNMLNEDVIDIYLTKVRARLGATVNQSTFRAATGSDF